GLPPGTYEIDPASGEGGALVSTDRVGKVEVGPDAVARVEVPLERLLAITGRVVDTRDGRGIAGVQVRSLLLDPQRGGRFVGQAQTDDDGRYTVGGKPGKIQLSLASVPKAYL